MKKLLNKKLLPFFSWLFFIPYPCLGNDKVFPAKDIKSIHIQVPRLNLKVTPSDSPVHTVKGTKGLDCKVEKEALVIKSQDFSSKKAWSNKNKEKPLELEISGPSKNLQIFSLFSDISISNWSQPVFISSFKSQIKSVNTKGSWHISLKEGAVNMKKHKSPLSVKAFKIHFNLNHSEGHFNFQVNEGKIAIKRSKGRMNFMSDKSKIQLTQFIGNLKGFNRLGEIRATIQADQVDISTEEGAVRFYFIKQGPKITAYTETGKIYAPRYFYKKFSGKSTQASGRIKAKIKKGYVSVKTERGNIYIN
ncbi:MAG: hypothetical protein OXN83_03295 [Oligoflexia bacterium]|nr:hypothetical protein [Oligoflexia bacterium]